MDDLFPTTQLIPVSQWEWWLYRVTYHATEEGPVLVTRWLVATETHIESEVWDHAPGDHATWAAWDQHTKASRPHSIGSIHGVRIDEDARTAGERVAKALGVCN